MAGFFDRFRIGTPPVAAKPYTDQGIPGFQVTGGYIATPESNPQLKGEARWRTASEIVTNFAIVAAGLRFSLNMVARPQWRAEAASDKPEAKAAAEFVDEVLDGIDASWTRIIRRTAMYRYNGFSIAEWTALKRDDGKIGIASLKSRPCHTITQWDIGDDGSVLGVIQRSPQTGQMVYLPRPKLVYIVDDTLTDRPDGLGLYRHLVEASATIKRYIDIETMGFERDLAGIPVAHVPITKMNAEVDAGRMTREAVAAAVNGIKEFVTMKAKRPSTGLVLDSQPYTAKTDTGETISAMKQWDLQLLTSQGGSLTDMGKAIDRLNFEMALVLGTEQMMMGGGRGGGNRALSEDKSRNLYLQANSALADMRESFDRDLIAPLWAMNGFDPELMPMLATEDASFRDAEAIATVLMDMAQAGAVLAPDDPAINDVRDLMNIERAPPPGPELLASHYAPTPPGGAKLPGRGKPTDQSGTAPAGGKPAANDSGQAIDGTSEGKQLAAALGKGAGDDATNAPFDKYSDGQPRGDDGKWSGGSMVVMRATPNATPSGLTNRNAGTAQGVAMHLVNQDDINSPSSLGPMPTHVHAYEVTPTKGETPSAYSLQNAGSGGADGVGVRDGGNKGTSYSFGASGYESKHLGSIALSDVQSHLAAAHGNGGGFDENGGNRVRDSINAVFAAHGVVTKYSDDQPRDDNGRFSGGGGLAAGAAGAPGGTSVIFEVAPNPDNKALADRWNSLTPAEKQSISLSMSNEFTPKVLAEIGVKGQVVPAMGAFEGQINPSFAMQVPPGDAIKAAGAIGETYGQKAMVVASPDPQPGLSQVGMVAIRAPDATEAQLHDINSKIGGLTDGWTYRNGQVEVLNFTGKSNSRYAKEIDTALDGSYRVNHGNIHTAYIEAKDYVSPRGNGSGTAGRSGGSSLGAAFSQRLQEQFAHVGKAETQGQAQSLKYSDDQPRDERGRFGSTGGGADTQAASAGAYPPGTAPGVMAAMTPEQVTALQAMVDNGAPADQILTAMQPLYNVPGATGEPTLTLTPDGNVPQGFFDGRQYNVDGKQVPIDQAVQHLMADGSKAAGPDGPGHDKEAIVLIGPPAAGKSTLATQLAGNGYAIVDADEAKALIPGYNNGLGAGIVHEESSAMSKMVQAQYQKDGTNMIVQTVSSGSRSVEQKVANLQKAGYNVSMVGLKVDEDVAVGRMAGRAIKTGRTVPEDVVRNAPALSMASYDTVKGSANGYAKVSSGRGSQGFRVIESTIPGIHPGRPL